MWTGVASSLTGAIAATAELDLPRWTISSLWTQAGIDPVPFVIAVWIQAVYLIGVWRMRRRGDRWPWGRTVAFTSATVAFLVATCSGLGAYDTTLLSVHMVQHMILSMVVPLLAALGAPVTLALRTLPRRGRTVLMSILHSRVARVLTFAPLVFAVYVISPWALYFSGWYAASLHSGFVHTMMHVHLVLVGSLFFWPLVGVDPVPGRVAWPFRLLLAMLTLPFHAFLGVTIMGQTSLIGGDWYPNLHDGPMGAWLPDPAVDQNRAGGILWASGDLIGLSFFIVLFVQWVCSSMREAAREDRRLDLLEARGDGQQPS